MDLSINSQRLSCLAALGTTPVCLRESLFPENCKGQLGTSNTDSALTHMGAPSASGWGLNASQSAQLEKWIEAAKPFLG